MFYHLLSILCFTLYFSFVQNMQIQSSASNSKDIQELIVGSENILWCNHSSKAKLEAWRIKGQYTNETKDGNLEMDLEKGQLKIKRGRRLEDEGDYECIFNKDGENKIIMLRAKPVIEKFIPVGKIKDVKSVNIVEDEDLTLQCIANSSIRVDFTWYMIQNSSSNPGMDEPKVVTLNHTLLISNNSTSEVTIRSIQNNQRAYYVCIASNEVGNVTYEMLVRVKDKYAAFWPFIGIVGEVIILCTIIFIYEKRRQKPDFDDTSDNPDESKSSVAQGTSKGQDIRQRK